MSRMPPRLVICDLAIPRRATPFRSRRPVVHGEGRRRAIGHQCLLPTRYLVRRIRGTTRRRIVNSTVRPDGEVPDAVKSETDRADSGISVIRYLDIVEKRIETECSVTGTYLLEKCTKVLVVSGRIIRRSMHS